MDCGLPGSSIHGILQATTLEWVAIPFCGDLPNPGIKQVGSWLSDPPGSLFLVLDSLIFLVLPNFGKLSTEAECWRIHAFELWCSRGLLRVPWTARRCNQSILKEISPEYSLEGLMLKLKLHYFGHLMRKTDSLEKTLMLGKTEGRRRRGRQRMRWLDGITIRFDGHESEQALGVGDRQGSLVCHSPWGCKELDRTEWLNWTLVNGILHCSLHKRVREIIFWVFYVIILPVQLNNSLARYSILYWDHFPQEFWRYRFIVLFIVLPGKSFVTIVFDSLHENFLFLLSEAFSIVSLQLYF